MIRVSKLFEAIQNAIIIVYVAMLFEKALFVNVYPTGKWGRLPQIFLQERSLYTL